MAGFGEKAALESGVTSLAGFDPQESGVTSLAGFAGMRLPQKRGSRTTTPAAFR